MRATPLHRAPTFFLKAVIVLMGTAATAACIFSFSNVSNGIVTEWPVLAPMLYPGLASIYLTIVPFLFALLQGFLLLRNIDANEAFSEASIKALRNIKWAAVAMSVLYHSAMPLMYGVAELDDAPGLIVMWFAFSCAPLVVAVFAAVLQKLVAHAVVLRNEHDLTV